MWWGLAWCEQAECATEPPISHVAYLGSDQLATGIHRLAWRISAEISPLWLRHNCLGAVRSLHAPRWSGSSESTTASEQGAVYGAGNVIERCFHCTRRLETNSERSGAIENATKRDPLRLMDWVCRKDAEGVTSRN